MSKLQIGTFAGGCFWCLDAIYRQTKGVQKVTSGFSGGHLENPSYAQMHQIDTGHAEAVQVEFDQNVVPYEVLLQIFWTTHNPTTPDQDGANIGPEYRSEVFYHDDEQKETAHKVLHDYAEKLWDDPIVTKITKYTNFYPAEDYHQDYYNKNPAAGYCQVIINPKIAKFQSKFAKWLV